MLCGIFAPEFVYATGSQIVFIAFALIGESVAITSKNVAHWYGVQECDATMLKNESIARYKKIS
jgi:hypothetical protein